MSVSINPGATVFAVIPRDPTSRASAFVGLGLLWLFSARLRAWSAAEDWPLLEAFFAHSFSLEPIYPAERLWADDPSDRGRPAPFSGTLS